MIGNTITRDGQNVPTHSLPMAGFNHTGVGNASARNQYPATGQIQDGSFVFAIASGTDTYTATLSPAIAAYVDGAEYRIRFTNANLTTTPTLNLNNIGAINIGNQFGGVVQAGEIQAGAECTLRYESAGPKMLLLVGARGSPTLLKSGIATAVSALPFTSLITSAFPNYLIKIWDHSPNAVTGTGTFLQVSTNNGSTYIASGYSHIINGTGVTSISTGVPLFTNTGASNPGDAGSTFEIMLSNPLIAAANKKIITTTLFSPDGSTLKGATVLSMVSTASAVNACAISVDVGNLTCNWEFWGLP